MQDPAALKKAWNELTLACAEVVQTRCGEGAPQPGSVSAVPDRTVLSILNPRSGTQPLRRALAAHTSLTGTIADLQARLVGTEALQITLGAGAAAPEAWQTAAAAADRRRSRPLPHTTFHRRRPRGSSLRCRPPSRRTRLERRRRPKQRSGSSGPWLASAPTNRTGLASRARSAALLHISRSSLGGHASHGSAGCGSSRRSTVRHAR